MEDREVGWMNVPDRVVRIELISYYSLYPETAATSRAMSERLNRDHYQVERQMKDLVELNILEKIGEGEDAVYTYISPMCLNLGSRKSRITAEESRVESIASATVNGSAGREARGSGGKSEEDSGEEGEASIRMKLMIDTLEREDWRDVLEVLVDTIYREHGTPCAAYHLCEGCSEMLWECQRGAGGVRVGMTQVENIQNMVVEGELIREKGFLETAHHLKSLYPLSEDEDILICARNRGSLRRRQHLLKSLIVDTLPVVAEKHRLRVAEEVVVEKMLQDSIYWSALHVTDMRRDMVGPLASVAKSIDADRVSLLLGDGKGSLRNLITYGLQGHRQRDCRPFRMGEGVAGWCAKNGDSANLLDPKADSRFIRNESDDIDSLLCCPLMPLDGQALGAICAVNKQGAHNVRRPHFNNRDVRLVEGVAKTLVNAFLARNNGAKVLVQNMLAEALAAPLI